MRCDRLSRAGMVANPQYPHGAPLSLRLTVAALALGSRRQLAFESQLLRLDEEISQVHERIAKSITV